MQTALISGIKLVSELSVNHTFNTVLLIKGYPAPTELRAEQIVIVTEEIMKKVTSLKEPEPLAAEIRLPPLFDLTSCQSLLILDQIADPGNLGNILRTALALGWEGVFLTSGAADPFNDKALRAAKGATFKLKICQGSYEKLFCLIKNSSLSLMIADAKGESIDSMILKPPFALVLGNESHGVHPDLKQIGSTIGIPMTDEMESLNVSSAGAILMFYLKGGLYGKR